MGEVIYFQLGDREEISLKALIRAFRDILGFLEDLDASVSEDPRGTVQWEVAVLQKTSPPLLGLVGHPKRPSSDQGAVLANFSRRVKVECLDSIDMLTVDAKRAQALSDSALRRVRNLAVQSKRLGKIDVYTDDRRVPITEKTLDAIEKLTAKKHESVGSVLGRLETIAVHRDTEIRVWDENTNRPVRCRYPIDLEDTVKALLRARVLVSGLVTFNPASQPVRVEVSSIERYSDETELPTIEQMSGLLPDATGGRTLAEYLEHLRDD